MSKPFIGYHQYVKKPWIKNKLKPSTQTINTSQSVLHCPGDMVVTPASIRSRYRNYPSTLREYWLIRIIFITWLLDAVEGNSVREITGLSWRHRFQKAPFSKYLVSTRDWAAGDSSGLKNVFVKLRYRDGLAWTVGLAVKIKLRFQNSFGIVWTLR